MKYGLPTYVLEAQPEFDKEKDLWYFESAISEGPAKSYILPSYIYNNLTMVLVVKEDKLRKYFSKKKIALTALKLACAFHVANELFD